MSDDQAKTPLPDSDPLASFLSAQGQTTYQGQINAGRWERENFADRPQSGQQPGESYDAYLTRLSGA